MARSRKQARPAGTAGRSKRPKRASQKKRRAKGHRARKEEDLGELEPYSYEKVFKAKPEKG